MTGRDLTKLPIFDQSLADCSSCELQPQCDRGQSCYSYRPKNFNGIMFIGDGPGQREVVEGKPFVGVSGQTLRQIAQSVGIDLDDSYVTNSTLCKPPPKDKGLFESFPQAIPSCLPRLEAEIEAVKPRVIVGVGAAALVAITGYDREIVKQVRFDCPHCDPDTRKVGPVLECNAPVPDPESDGTTTIRCGQLHFLRGETKEDVDPNEVALLRDRGCQKCGAKLKRVQPKMVKCPACQGRKTRSESELVFSCDHKLKSVAGAIFEPVATEDAAPKPHEINHAFGQWGVRYFVPTYHPAFLLRDQQFMAKPVQHHLKRALRLVSEDVDLSLRFEVTKDPARVREFTRADAGKPQPVYTIDIETEAIRDGEAVDARQIPNVTAIKCVGIGTWSRGFLVVDTREVNPEDEGDELLNALQDFLEDTEIPKSYHNGLYDVPVMVLVWMLDETKLIDSYADDTLGAHALLYPDEPHDLQHVTLDLVDTYAWKPAKRVRHQEVHKDFAELAEYNAHDIRNTDSAREALGVENGQAVRGARLDRAKLGSCYALDSKIRRIAVEMSLAGLPLNKARWAEIGKEADREVDEAIERCKTLLRDHTRFEADEFKPFAPKQLGEILFSATGFMLPPSQLTSSGQHTTDQTTLRRLRDAERTANPDGSAFIDGLLDLRKAHKTRATYVYSDAMQPWDDDRIHPIWKPWGTRTGRFSSSPNAQSFPKWLRVAVEAPAGRMIVGADFDQLELRIMAALSGDPEMIRRCMESDESRKLEPDWDPHSFVAGLAFVVRYTDLLLKDPAHQPEERKCPCQTCKRKALRDLIKRVVYGLGYGAGDAKIIEAIYSTGDYVGPPITLEMVAHVRKTIFRTFPKLADYRVDILDKARAEGEIRSAIYNRRRIFPLDEVSPPEIYNYPIQSTAGDIMNERTVLVREQLPGVDNSAFIFAQVHDALYVECAEDRAEAVTELLTNTLTCEKSFQEGAPAMRFTAQAVATKNWKDAG